MKLGLLGCSRRAVSIELEKRARVMIKKNMRVGECLQDVEWARMTQEISENKIKQDWLGSYRSGVNKQRNQLDN